MFKAIAIKNFRCFQEFHIDSLAKVNLIAGKNNVGKTALLEAIFLLAGAENIGLVVNISRFRGIGTFKADPQAVFELLWSPLFYNFQDDATICLIGELKTGGSHIVELALSPATSQTLVLNEDVRPETDRSDLHKLKLTYTQPSGQVSAFEMAVGQGNLTIKPVPSNPPFPGYFLSARQGILHEEDAEQFGRIEKEKLKPKTTFDIEQILKDIIEPRLTQFKTIQNAGVTMLWGDIGLDQMLPLSLMGDGMGRLVSILLRIANASGGILLIDEVENGLHHSIHRDVWQAIGRAANIFNTQVFAATHSYECLKGAHEAFKESEAYDFRLHRLDRIGSDIKAVVFDRDTLETAIEAFLEVR
jgi:hypothetical protein